MEKYSRRWTQHKGSNHRSSEYSDDKAKQKRHALLILGFPNKTILVHHEDTKAESNFLLAK